MSGLKIVFISLLLVVCAVSGTLPGFSKSQFFDEQIITFNYPSDVRIHINAPSADSLQADRPTSIILYALPNGNTIEWTEGKEAAPDEDWHYEIQHIAAQTRFLRNLVHERNIVVAYLEASGLSWPIWSSNHPDDKYDLVYSIVDKIESVFQDYPHEIVINGHSGGGNFEFNYIDGQASIPDFVKRISFLDSDYNYSNTLDHGAKLADWLNAAEDHYLCVLAYNDSVALYEGLPIVSATGGTWYRTKMMQRKLAEYFEFTFEENDDFLKYFALNGRIQIWLKKNPDRIILHTVQVERNGYIHSIVSGTQNDQNTYTYYGERAYEQYIEKLPPEIISTLMVTNNNDGNIRFSWNPVEHGDIYRVFWGRDGKTFSDSIDTHDTSLNVPGLENDSLYFFRIQGVSPWGKSEKSEVLAGVAGESNPGVIIINGFDAVKTENTRDFVRQHADAFFRNGVHPVSASNDAMTAGLLNLTEYPVVDFIIGSDIYLNESVSPDEQELLKTYLQNGGRLFISGNDLAFDMDSKAKDNDQDFCYNYLKLKYFSRSPLDQKSVYYQVNLFDNAGIQDTFFFDNGEHGTYDVSRPDAIKPINGSLPFLVFTGIDTSLGVAGVAFNGIFPSGNTNGRVVATSIPLETIYPESARAKFISSVLNFYAQPDQIEKNVSLSVNHFELKQNYPNPFNPKTHINYQLPVASEIDLSIFDILGQKVATLVSGKQPAGKYQVEWDASVNLGPREGLASGFYLCRLSTSSGYTATRKLLLIK